MNLHPGQLVICVDDAPLPSYPYRGEVLPKKGVVYTVRDVFSRPSGDGLWVEEIVNAKRQYSDGFGELAFATFRFRPLSESRLAIFRQHLAPTPADTVDA